MATLGLYSLLIKGHCTLTRDVLIWDLPLQPQSNPASSVALSKLWRSSLPWSLRVKKNAQSKPKHSAKSHLTRVAGSQLSEAMKAFASF